MSRKKTPQVTPFQLIYERILRISLLLLGTFHMILSFARHYFSPENALFRSLVVRVSAKAEEWFALALLVAALLYLVLSKARFHDTWLRVRAWFSGVRSVEGILLFCLFGYFVFCSYITSKYYTNVFKTNDFLLFDTAVCILVFFTMPLAVGVRKAKLYIDIMLHITMLLSTIFIVWALWNLFRLNLVTLPNGLQFGMTEGYRLYPGVNSNIGAAIGVTMVLISLYMISSHRWPIKLIYSIVLIPHLCATILTNSRGSFLSLIVAFPLFAFMLVWGKTQKLHAFKRALISGIAAVAMIAFVILVRYSVFYIFEKVTHLSEYLGAEPNIREIEPDSARLKIWNASVHLMFSDAKEFFFGAPITVIPTQIKDSLTRIYGNGSLFAHAHNIILQTGLIAGVPGMLLFLAFLFRILMPCVRIGIGKKSQAYPGSYFLPIAVLAMLVANMFEPFLLFYISSMACLFFLFCGYIVAIDREESAQ